MTDGYTYGERDRLARHLPEGVVLVYSATNKAYELRIKEKPTVASRLLCSIPRSEILAWRRRKRVINYVARRAMADAGYAVEFRVAKQ
jgi:uncharacterized secreted protein with C-terminal beta-propeller domain